MRLPIDVTTNTFTAAGAAESVLDSPRRSRGSRGAVLRPGELRQLLEAIPARAKRLRDGMVQEHLDGDFNDGDRSILRRPGADLLLAPSRSNWSARGTVVPE